MLKSSLRGWMASLGAASLAAASILVACGDDEAAPGGGGDGGLDATESFDSSNGNLLDGGDGGAQGDSAPPPTAASACNAYLAAESARRVECGFRVGVNTNSKLCPDLEFGVGSPRTIAQVLACADALRVQPCNEAAAGLVPMACAILGTVPEAGACEFDTQCASGKCSPTTEGVCGSCARLVPLDGGCTNPPPVVGIVAAASLAVAPAVAAPAPAVTPNDTCGYNATCIAGHCQPIPTTPALPRGASCPGDGAVDCQSDMVCSATTPQSASGTCEVRPAVGASCRFEQGTSRTVCAFGSHCVLRDSNNGTCVQDGTLGDTCGRLSPRRTTACQPGLYCSDLNSGNCILRTQANEACTGNRAGQCVEGTYCKITNADTNVGMCVPAAQPGEGCPQNIQVDGGSTSKTYSVECAPSSSCRQEVYTDGGFAYKCFADPAGIGETCDAKYRPCISQLQCGANSKCALLPCPPDGGG